MQTLKKQERTIRDLKQVRVAVGGTPSVVGPSQSWADASRRSLAASPQRRVCVSRVLLNREGHRGIGFCRSWTEKNYLFTT